MRIGEASRRANAIISVRGHVGGPKLAIDRFGRRATLTSASRLASKPSVPTSKVFRMLRLMLREASLPRRLSRIPEPSAVMESEASIAGFDEQGSSALLPIYRFNAMAISGLAPANAHVVDIGCGTGRFLACLAAHRPDLTITGIDLAADMVRIGRRHLARAGLDARVRLIDGDMREFRKVAPARIDLVSSIFSLHHLPTRADLLACLREIAGAIGSGDRLWIFDHARPRRRRTAVEVPEIFTPGARPAFQQDSYNSLCASWSFDELRAALREILPVELRAARAKLLPLYQIHWTPVAPAAAERARQWIEDETLSPDARRGAQLLSHLFSTGLGRSGDHPWLSRRKRR